MAPTCVSVGEGNPDVAGLGIIIAFTVQSAISIALSAWSYKVEGDIRSLKQQDEDRRDDGDGDGNGRPRKPPQPGVELFSLRTNIQKLPDRIFGIGAGGPRQPGRPNAARPIDTAEVAERRKRLEGLQSILDRILVGVSDIQTMTGISLLIAALVTWKTLSLYHQHIVYDVLNFTAISFSTGNANIFRGKERKGLRSAAAFGFGVMYFAYCIMFGRALESWDYEAPGRCYETNLNSTNDAQHPYVDRIFLGITALYLFASLLGSSLYAYMFQKRNPRVAAAWAGNLLVVAAVQWPVHVYSVVALRVANRGRLEGDSEDSWGYGQIVAVVLLFGILIECVKGFLDYQHLRSNRGTTVAIALCSRCQGPVDDDARPQNEA